MFNAGTLGLRVQEACSRAKADSEEQPRTLRYRLTFDENLWSAHFPHSPCHTCVGCIYHVVLQARNHNTQPFLQGKHTHIPLGKDKVSARNGKVGTIMFSSYMIQPHPRGRLLHVGACFCRWSVYLDRVFFLLYLPPHHHPPARSRFEQKVYTGCNETFFYGI